MTTRSWRPNGPGTTATLVLAAFVGLPPFYIREARQPCLRQLPTTTMGDRLTQLQDAADQVRSRARRCLDTRNLTDSHSWRSNLLRACTTSTGDTIWRPSGPTTKSAM